MEATMEPGTELTGAQLDLLEARYAGDPRVTALIAEVRLRRRDYPEPEPGEPDYMAGFREHWAELVCAADGTLILDRVARELADYWTLIGHATEVYDTVTGSRISKPLTMPAHVIQAVDERIQHAEETARGEGDPDARREGAEDALRELYNALSLLNDQGPALGLISDQLAGLKIPEPS